MSNTRSRLCGDFSSRLGHQAILRHAVSGGKYAGIPDVLARAHALECGLLGLAGGLMKARSLLAGGDDSHRTLIGGAWAVLFATVFFAYWPGLNGPFVLDDFGSVAALGERGGVVDWTTFKAFVFGGSSGPTGRPLSLLTFLLDANNWPAESWPFKRTNLLIHCLCGVFLGLLSREILKLLRVEKRDARLLTLATVGVWLLHPFLVSTTLYVVQRMAQLSTLFSLAGLTLYVRGRILLPGNKRRAYVLMTVSLVLFGILAILSKENGILLPLLAAVIEITVVASQRDRLGSLHRLWVFAFFVVPATVIVVYLSARVFQGSFFEIVPPRDFSLYERGLTQPRVLFDYLQHWFVPKLYTTGVFQDHFLKSTGLLTPITTLISLIAHAVIVVLVFIKRRRWPLLAFAVLFFYTAHILESTVMNLELYFEHRNYLAAGFLFLPLLAAAHRKLNPRQFVLATALIFALLGSFTRYSSSVWASIPSMIEASAQKAPTSARAQAQYSVMLFNAGQYEESLEVLDRAIENIPMASPLLKVNRLTTRCHMNQLRSEEFDNEVRELTGIPYDVRSITVYSSLANAIANGKCPDVVMTQLNAMFTQMLQLPYNANRTTLGYSHIQYFIGFSYAYSGHPEKAVSAFHESLSARPGASQAMQMAALLASNDFGAEALKFSELALAQLGNQPASMIRAAPVRESDIRVFQATVRADMEALAAPNTSRPEP